MATLNGMISFSGKLGYLFLQSGKNKSGATAGEVLSAF